MNKTKKDIDLCDADFYSNNTPIPKRKGYASLDPNKNPYLPPGMPTTYDEWVTGQSGGSGKPTDDGAYYLGNSCPITNPDFYAEYNGVWLGETAECKHEPIDVGFRFSKMVCKKCDKELKS